MNQLIKKKGRIYKSTDLQEWDKGYRWTTKIFLKESKMEYFHANTFLKLEKMDNY